MSKSNHKQVLAEIEDDLFDAAINALNATQALAINYLRSEGEGTQQGVRLVTSVRGATYYDYSPSYPRRDAHPGRWADVTGLTANSYDFEQANIDNGNIVGALYNTAPYAADLEGKRRKEGGRYYVLLGLLQDDEFSLLRTYEQQFAKALE